MAVDTLADRPVEANLNASGANGEPWPSFGLAAALYAGLAIGSCESACVRRRFRLLEVLGTARPPRRGWITQEQGLLSCLQRRAREDFVLREQPAGQGPAQAKD